MALPFLSHFLQKRKNFHRTIENTFFQDLGSYEKRFTSIEGFFMYSFLKSRCDNMCVCLTFVSTKYVGLNVWTEAFVKKKYRRGRALCCRQTSHPTFALQPFFLSSNGTSTCNHERSNGTRYHGTWNLSLTVCLYYTVGRNVLSEKSDRCCFSLLIPNEQKRFYTN